MTALFTPDECGASAPSTETAPSNRRPAHPWDNDLCTCGHTRVQHKRGKRQPWPVTGTVRGACTQACQCSQLDIDEAALKRAEAASFTAIRAELAEQLAEPGFGLRYRPRRRAQ